VTESGHSIGEIAALSDEQLQLLLREDEAARPLPSAETQGQVEAGEGYVNACFEALDRLDGGQLQAVLTRSAVELGPTRFTEFVALPFLQRIGSAWERGELRPGYEHLASVSMRQVLGWLLETFQATNGASTLVATTPAGQRHEFGAMLAGAIAAAAGWRTVYLGPDLPAEDIAVVAHKVGAQAVALSMVYPTEDSVLVDELRRLRELLPEGTSVLVGGRAAYLYQRQIEGEGAELVPDLKSLQERLRLS
jgi:methanogenic corrinoid protein MtbC1